MRRRQLKEMIIALLALVMFALLFLGAAQLANGEGGTMCIIGGLMAVPVIYFTNREEKA